jgi:hypothetical protein
VNWASTDFAASMVTWQVPVPEQQPPVQKAKVDPVSTLAVSVTEVL